jgi:uncharacterized membrane protein
MSTIVIMTYDTEDQAFTALDKLKDAEKQKLVEIEDAVVVRKDAEGKVHVKETRDFTTRRGAVTGGAIGLVIGVVLGGPIGAAVVGSVAGGLIGKAVDLGFSKDQIAIVGEKMNAGNSAIFAKLKTEKMDLLKAAIAQSPGHLVEFSVSEQAQADLEEVDLSAIVGHTNE